MPTSHTISTWNIDPTHVEAGFAVKHLMISTVRGRFGAVSGTVRYDETEPSRSTVDVTIDVNSIDTRQEQRDAHLRSADFFDVEHHPTIRFVSKRVEGDVDGDFRIVGDLTIRGTTRELTLHATGDGQTIKDPWGGERRGFSATAKLNRSDFGLTWNVALEAGGLTVGDEVKLTIEAELVKQAEVAATAGV